MAAIFDTYFTRFCANTQQLQQTVLPNVGIIVTIPCYNEPDIFTTLNSLCACQLPSCDVEIIITVNYSETAANEVKQREQESFEAIAEYARAHSTLRLQLLPLFAPNLPAKFAGVGLARKISMDEAIHRFSRTNNVDGIIASCDADVTVDANYFVEIEKFYQENPECGGANCYFEHPLEGDLPQYQYDAITQYELYLRYYVEQLKRIGFPYAYHTIGSCFTLRATTYCRQGGMNKRQAGEDFYFLQKLFLSEPFGEINSTRVMPSSRISERVPFGTGTMISKITTDHADFMAFGNEGFNILQAFFQNIPLLRSGDIQNVFNSLHPYLQEFLGFDIFNTKICEIRQNSATPEKFRKRFFFWFNGFLIFRFLNFAHQDKLKKVPIAHAAANLIPCEETNALVLLETYRKGVL